MAERVSQRGEGLGSVRDGRAAGGSRPEVPAMALPSLEDRRARHRLQARYRRHRGRVLSGQGARAQVLPGAVAGTHVDVAAPKRLRAYWQGNHQHDRVLLLVILSDYCCETHALMDMAEALPTVVPINDGYPLTHGMSPVYCCAAKPWSQSLPCSQSLPWSQSLPSSQT